MICRQCKNDFNPSDKPRRGQRRYYCSDFCVDASIKKVRDSQYKKLDSCEQCGHTIPERGTRRGAHSKYCSQVCRADAKKEYHAMYDSTQEQRKRRSDYAKTKKV